MALELTYVDEDAGLTLTDAYQKVLRVDLMTNTRVNILVGIYTSAGQVSYVKTQEYSLHESGDVEGNTPFADNFSITALDAVDANPIKNAYNYLKTLTEFDGAEDVLES